MSTPPGQATDPFGPEALPITVSNRGAAFASGQLAQGQGLVTAVTAHASSSTTPPRFQIVDGTDSSGIVLAFIAMQAGGSYVFTPAGAGIPFRSGLYLYVEAGGALITVTYVPFYQLP